MGPSVTMPTQPSARNQRRAHEGTGPVPSSTEDFLIAQAHPDSLEKQELCHDSDGCGEGPYAPRLSISAGKIRQQPMGAGFKPRQPSSKAWDFTAPSRARKKVPWLELERKILLWAQGTCRHPYQWVSMQGAGPGRRPGQLPCPKSRARAESPWVPSVAWIQRCPSNRRQQPHKQDGPWRRQAGRGPA